MAVFVLGQSQRPGSAVFVFCCFSLGKYGKFGITSILKGGRDEFQGSGHTEGVFVVHMRVHIVVGVGLNVWPGDGGRHDKSVRG